MNTVYLLNPQKELKEVVVDVERAFETGEGNVRVFFENGTQRVFEGFEIVGVQ
jgi:hypothetical protein